MKKKESEGLLGALKSVNVCELEGKDDRFAVIENIIALSDEMEEISKLQKQAVETFKPEGWDDMDEDGRKKAYGRYNEQVSDFLSQKLEEETACRLKPLTADGVASIVGSAALKTVEKALVVKLLKG